MTRARADEPGLGIIAPLLLLLVLVLGWWATTSFTGVEAWRLPSPGAVAVRGVDLLSQAWMWQRIGVTAGEALLGCILGVAAALPLSWLIHRSRVVAAAVEPFLGATQALPAIALAPLLVLWIGYGTWAIAALCALMVFFPILVSTVLGLRHLDPEVMEAAELDGAQGWTLVWRMEAPLAAPSILAGLRTGFTLSVTGAVVGEMVMGGEGLGQVLVQARTSVDTASMFVTILVLCAMATSVFVMVRQVERRARTDLRPSKNRS
ncbi:ABC transporter permease [Schaalia sp. 19OD2882]|uniref:ABC transporter permease n=1 Tax=Schaalia sp. 19OD2882 TaxID=2794089 RepID=UPI001C1EF0DF|nr:ABC transporter permease [Schaalia sp. 19OD2882]QWW18690.1 ABC transporter permease [Schaalia sp. 19OD2882]